MIDQLDSTLRELLKSVIPELDDAKITFAAPTKQFDTDPAVNLFLYDVRENLELRSNEWKSVQKNGAGLAAERMPPPVRVDCSYLVTCWTGGESHPENEHKLLGRVMSALLRYRRIPEAFMPIAWRDEQAHLPLPTAALHAGQLQSMGEFWQAMGDRPPKAALHYTVTIAVQPFAATTAPLVLTNEVR